MSETLAIREKHDGALDERSSVRLWLRLFTCTMAIEKHVRRRFAERGATLPRFDVLAALDRNPGGMSMGALSRALLVSNGNVTQLVRKLAADGLVRMTTPPADRRASIARLTPRGRTEFAALAAAHHDWIDTLVAGMDGEARETLYHMLGELKQAIAKGRAVES